MAALRKLAEMLQDSEITILKSLKNQDAVKTLFDVIGPNYSERPGGYLRVIKRGHRSGDKSPIAQIEFLQEEAETAQEEITEEATS